MKQLFTNIRTRYTGAMDKLEARVDAGGFNIGNPRFFLMIVALVLVLVGLPSCYFLGSNNEGDKVAAMMPTVTPKMLNEDDTIPLEMLATAIPEAPLAPIEFWHTGTPAAEMTTKGGIDVPQPAGALEPVRINFAIGTYGQDIAGDKFGAYLLWAAAGQTYKVTLKSGTNLNGQLRRADNSALVELKPVDANSISGVLPYSGDYVMGISSDGPFVVAVDIR